MQLALARQIVRRLPALHQAMLAGDIDAHKAKVICEQLLLLSDEQARAVVDKILPEAAGKTTGQLRYKLARRVAAAHCCAAAPSEPYVPLFAAYGSSKPQGRFRLQKFRVPAGAGRPAVAGDVYKADFVRRAAPVGDQVAAW